MPSLQHVVRPVVGVLAAAAIFGGGVAVGNAGSSPAPATSSTAVLGEAAQTIQQQAAHPVAGETLERAAVTGMLDTLDDRWAAYYDAGRAEDFQDSLDGRYTGVGLWVRRATAEQDAPLDVVNVLPASAAAQAGVAVGDVVTAVAGHPVSGRSVGEVAAELRGKAGTTVALSLRRDGRLRELALQRTEVEDDDVMVDQPAAGVTRIQVTSFTRGVGRQVRDAVHHLGSGDRGVLLDLRGNSGGLLDEAVDVASVFLDGGPVVTYLRRGEPPHELTATAGGDTSSPVVVLTDGATASAAEVVAAALADRSRAVVVGTRTFGKGSVQAPIPLSDGSALELTVGRYVTPAGHSLDGVGIAPDVAVPPGSGPQEAVDRAVAVLRGLLADAGGRG